MTAVLAAVDSKYIARITCSKGVGDSVDCRAIARRALENGKRFISGITDCEVWCDEDFIYFDVTYESIVEPDDLHGKLYATVLVAAHDCPNLSKMIAINIDVEEVFS